MSDGIAPGNFYNKKRHVFIKIKKIHEKERRVLIKGIHLFVFYLN
jgi:hypothetical protein